MLQCRLLQCRTASDWVWKLGEGQGYLLLADAHEECALGLELGEARLEEHLNVSEAAVEEGARRGERRERVGARLQLRGDARAQPLHLRREAGGV